MTSKDSKDSKDSKSIKSSAPYVIGTSQALVPQNVTLDSSKNNVVAPMFLSNDNKSSNSEVNPGHTPCQYCHQCHQCHGACDISGLTPLFSGFTSNLHNNGVGYFLPLNWGKGFEKFRMTRICTIADGNCFFHALLNAFFENYRIERLDQIVMSKSEIVSNLRHNLAVRLSEPSNSKDNKSFCHYDLLSRGNFRVFSEAVPDYSLSEMKRRLDSSASIGNEFNEFLSNQLNKDIYLLELKREDVYITGNDKDLLYKNRDSIVILYMEGHYELIGLLPEGSNGIGEQPIDTLFKPSHPFIRFLNERMDVLIEQGSKRAKK